MKNILKRFLPQWVINWFYHLPTAVLANIIYLCPSRKLKVIGVTGTDGKTTTVNMIYKILKDAGKNVSMVSTINAPGSHVTSPNPFTVQRLLKKALQEKAEYIVLEITSHALDQFRFWGVKFLVAVITNITHEHLDYHKTKKNYSEAKAKLLKGVKYAILNQDEKHFKKLAHSTPGVVTSFGLSKSADFNDKKFPLHLKIPGQFNILNALAAAACCSNLKIDSRSIRDSLNSFSALPGRMEFIKNHRAIKIVVDFAHTPNGLEQALKTLKPSTQNQLIAVFGSAGKRDVEKRSLMGQITAKLADITVVTAEDPRGELEIINRQIVEGALREGAILNKNLFIIADRKKAIDFAINRLAKKGDIVGIFGKGHEKSMNLDGKHEIPWSDQEEVKKVLKQNGG